MNETNPEVLFGAIDKFKYTGNLTQFNIVPIYSEDLENPNEDLYITTTAITLKQITFHNGKIVNVLGKGFYPAVVDTYVPYMILPDAFYEAIVVSLWAW